MSRPKRTQFPAELPRGSKREAGATDVEQTPLTIRATGIKVSSALKQTIRKRVSARLGKFASHIERLTVRFEDLNGPKGGPDDVLCRANVVLSGLPSVVVDARAATDQVAFRQVIDSLTRAVKKAVDRAPTATKKRRRASATANAAVTSESREAVPKGRRADDPGSLIGRRVGRGPKNLAKVLERPEKRRRDATTDTAAPGVSATARKAGGNSTARRNAKARAPRATAALEDSRQDTPSRKSTRKSANRSKSGTNIQKRVVAATRSPKARARKAKAKAKVG